MATNLYRVKTQKTCVSVAGVLLPLCKHDLKYPHVAGLSWKRQLNLQDLGDKMAPGV